MSARFSALLAILLLITIQAGASAQVHSFDVTSLANEWVNDPAKPNCGLLLNITDGWELNYASRENTTSAYRPILDISYGTNKLFLPAAADTYTFGWGEPYWSTNYGASQAITILEDRAHGYPTGYSKGLLRFDLSGIPTGTHVDSATLKLTVTSIHPLGCAGNVEVYRITKPWDELQCTSHNATSSTPWSTLEGDYVGTTGIMDQAPYAVKYGPFGNITIDAYPFRDKAVQRAGRVEKISIRLENPTEQQLPATVTLVAPPGLTIIDPATQQVSSWGRKIVYACRYNCNPFDKVPEKRLNATLTWRVQADQPLTGQVKFLISGEQVASSEKTLDVHFLEPLTVSKADYVPEPKPASTQYMIGAMHWPGWETGCWTATGWSPIEPYPWRKPALGYYDDSNPEVVDWEIKWALEHGINFFCYVWGRDFGSCSGGDWTAEVKPGPWGYAIHKGLFNSRYQDRFKFCIMYEYLSSMGSAQLNGLMSFWLNNYFKKPGYLKLDNKPVLYFYEYNQAYIDQLGGTANTKALLDSWRQQCVDAGFAGLYIIAEYRGGDPNVVQRIKDAGFDGTFSYCYADRVPDGTSPASALDIVYSGPNSRVQWNILPDVPTISMGWDPTPWQTYTNYWPTNHFQFNYTDYKTLCGRVKNLVDNLPQGSLGKRMLLLDNWNEWGEGHYMAPGRQQGFGYVDAIRETFAAPSLDHIDLLPEDVGLGPYDTLYLTWKRNQETPDLANLKKLNDGASGSCSGMTVTAVFGDSFYIEQPNRTNAIRVYKPGHSMCEGFIAAVSGTIATDLAAGERYIDASSGSVSGLFGGYLPPLGMVGRSVGVGSGMSTLGLLVRVAGRVKARIDSSTFTLDDGSGVIVKVTCPSGSAPAQGAFVSVTGISAYSKLNKTSAVKVAKAEDIMVL